MRVFRGLLLGLVLARGGLVACGGRVSAIGRAAVPAPDAAEEQFPPTGDLDGGVDAVAEDAAEACLGHEVTFSAECTAEQAARVETFPPGTVGSSGWTWFNSLPTGYQPLGVWAAGADDGWTVGTFGSILHCGSSACVSVPSGTNEQLNAIWGTSPSDIWAVGNEGGIVHWDGSAWRAVASPTSIRLIDVVGTGASDVWAMGSCGVALHWNGSTWSMQKLAGEPALRPHQSWAATSSDAWALTIQGPLHWDGACWSYRSQDLTADVMRARRARGSSDAGTFRVQYDRLSGSGADVWVTGTVISSTEYVGSPFASHWDGQTWTSVIGPLPEASSNWADVFSTDAWPRDLPARMVFEAAASRDPTREPPDGWIVNGSVWHFAAGNATTLTTWNPTGICSLWASPAAAGALAVDCSGQIRGFDGNTWSARPTGLSALTASGATRTLVDVWALGPDDVWSVGDRIVAHFDGTTWRALGDEVDRYRSVWGSSSNDVWAVGKQAIGHWDGSTWTNTAMGGFFLEKVSGASATSVWAVGHTEEASGSGVILHWDGSTWTSAEALALAPLYGISALPSGEAWAVGNLGQPPEGASQGVIVHFDGTTWQPQSLPDGSTLPWLRAVWAVSPREVWAASNEVLQWNGVSWAIVPAPAGLSVNAMGGALATGVWVAGNNGAILRYLPGP
jgi:hypothetical protein